MKEIACQFGPQQQLAGILTVPSEPARQLGCVLVSAGLVPKFGPYRLYAQLARALAREGYVTLRFDLGGLGDSPLLDAREVLRVRTDREVGAAVDYLCAARAPRGIVVGGLCSGAADALRYAEHDPRVTGVLLIDPFSYATSGSRWRYLAMRVAARGLRALGVYAPRPKAASVAAAGGRVVAYKYMEQPESRRILRTLLARGVRVHFVYTGGMRQHFNDPAQLPAMFPDLDFAGLVTIDHHPRTDHTQFLEEDRRALIDGITRQLARAG